MDWEGRQLMPKFAISGYARCSVVAEVEAKNIKEARLLAANLAAPIVYARHSSELDDEYWHFDEFSDMPDDCVCHVERIKKDPK